MTHQTGVSYVSEFRRNGSPDAWEDSVLVFATSLGGPIDPTYLRRAGTHYGSGPGLSAVRFHDLRHSCVTLLLRLDVPLHIARGIVGHSAVDVTMTIYAHVSLDDKREAPAEAGHRTSWASTELLHLTASSVKDTSHEI
ncbi:tyrosine-type recombinase/integrase [Solihabitans fulvus]|uniref:tyrosine-type recombinase/integrase n=1 Tax=Solihabitans fulvus TaxID=1892852 RepID=UPI0034D2DEAE